MTAKVGKSLVGHYSTHITATSRQVIAEYGFNEPSFARIPKQAVYCGFRTERFIGERSVTKSSLCDEFGWPANAIVIIFVGRTDWAVELGHPQNHKNSGFAVSVGIEAAKLDARVRMLMDGQPKPETPKIKQRVSEAGMATRIVFPGIRLDVERLMLGSDVLLFPSRGEGLGMAAVEAQAAGLPVLASDAVPRECVVIPELVRFQSLHIGETAWALNLLDLAKHPQNNVASNRRVAASVFSIEASANTLFRLYTEGKLPC
jgi:glycosyltransferase involved in cell wall biosynthesis